MEQSEIKYFCGIDLLKIIAMVFIAILHIIGHGGGINTAQNGAYYVIWLLETICICGVDCYAIISGFIGYQRKHTLRKYILLWLQVFFYSVVFNIIFAASGNIGISAIIKSVFPVSFNQYWYFTAYSVVFLFMPLIDHLVNVTSEIRLKKILICIVFVTIYATLDRRWNDIFLLRDGYGYVWLLVLYFIGAVIKKCQLYINIRVKYILATYIAFIAVTYLWTVWFGKLLGHGIDELLLSYTSPTILGISISLVLLFAKLEFNSSIVKKIARSSFGVYLFHDSNCFRELFVKKNLAFIGSLSALEVAPVCIGIAVLFYAVGFVMEQIRMLLLRLLNISFIADILEKYLNKFYTNVFQILNVPGDEK